MTLLMHMSDWLYTLQSADWFQPKCLRYLYMTLLMHMYDWLYTLCSADCFQLMFLCYPCMSQLMHVSDWLPTLYSAAGGDIAQLGSNLDGVDQWHSLVNNEETPRHQLLVNINEREETAALRVGDWKLVLGGYPATSVL
jgi:hypothetical protein